MQKLYVLLERNSLHLKKLYCVQKIQPLNLASDQNM